MKKRIFCSLLLAMSIVSLAYSQLVHEGAMSVVYYMPQTQLAITVDYDEVSVIPGPFYLYAERYLGVKDVATEAQTRYHMTGIHLSPRTVADADRPIQVLATAGGEGQWLSLTAEGLLYGYNVESSAQPAQPQEVSELVEAPAAMTLMPLMEEQMVASSIAKMAEGAAKQIYHIREMRINLLGGDVEHTPADGQAMQLVLSELDRREQMLAELFIGTRTVRHHQHTILYVPTEDVEDYVVARMSQYSGVVAADDLSGEPIRLSLTGQYQTYLPELPVDSKSKVLPSQVYYNLPGSAQVHVACGQYIQITTQLPIAQFGVAVPLSKNLLTQRNTPHIYFNTQTGNILSIQQ